MDDNELEAARTLIEFAQLHVAKATDLPEEEMLEYKRINEAASTLEHYLDN